MLSSRKQVDGPLTRLMKNSNVDQRLRPFVCDSCQQFDRAIDLVCKRRAIAVAKNEQVPRILPDADAVNRRHLLLDRKGLPQPSLEVHVIGCRGTTFGAVVDNEVSW